MHSTHTIPPHKKNTIMAQLTYTYTSCPVTRDYHTARAFRKPKNCTFHCFMAPRLFISWYKSNAKPCIYCAWPMKTSTEGRCMCHVTDATDLLRTLQHTTWAFWLQNFECRIETGILQCVHEHSRVRIREMDPHYEIRSGSGWSIWLCIIMGTTLDRAIVALHIKNW